MSSAIFSIVDHIQRNQGLTSISRLYCKNGYSHLAVFWEPLCENSAWVYGYYIRNKNGKTFLNNLSIPHAFFKHLKTNIQFIFKAQCPLPQTFPTRAFLLSSASSFIHSFIHKIKPVHFYTLSPFFLSFSHVWGWPFLLSTSLVPMCIYFFTVYIDVNILI